MKNMKRILTAVLALILMTGFFTVFAEPTVPDFTFDAEQPEMGETVFRQYLDGYLARLNISEEEYADQFKAFLAGKDMDTADYETYMEGYFAELGFDALLFDETKLDELFAQRPYLPLLDDFIYEYITGTAKASKEEEDLSNAGMTLYATADVNVRSGPGTEYDKLGSVHKAAKLTLIKEGSSVDGNPWYNVTYNTKGAEGWISGKYISETKPVTAGGSGTITLSGGDSYLRNEPNINAGKITVISKGSVLSYSDTAYEDRDGVEVKWYKVSYEGKKGWVSGRYATEGGDPSKKGGKEIHEKSKKYEYYLEATASTNIRKQADKSSKVIASITKEQRVPYLGVKKKDDRGVMWYKVEYYGKAGWISSKYTKMHKGSFDK